MKFYLMTNASGDFLGTLTRNEQTAAEWRRQGVRVLTLVEESATSEPAAREPVSNAYMLPSAPVVPVVTECQWREDENGDWETSCGATWSFIDDGPERNGVKFCHSCGKPCSPKAFEYPPDDDAASEVRG